jgi:Beta-lactamase class C and other penicillin binding proteins
MTKAVGSTAAMILMDRGKLDPNTPVDAIIPEFARLRCSTVSTVPHRAFVFHAARQLFAILQRTPQVSSMNSGIPIFLNTWKRRSHPSILSGLKTSLFYPLAFDPGERWDYGPGIDWLGQVVEAVDGRKIDHFCREEILDPLKMLDTRFEVEDRMASRLSSVSIQG